MTDPTIDNGSSLSARDDRIGRIADNVLGVICAHFQVLPGEILADKILLAVADSLDDPRIDDEHRSFYRRIVGTEAERARADAAVIAWLARERSKPNGPGDDAELVIDDGVDA